MKKLKKYILEFNEALTFFSQTLLEVNEVSNAIMRLVDFKIGCFFTLFPKNIDIKKLCDFEYGGILPQTSLKEMSILGKQMKAQVIPTVRTEITHLIKDMIFSSKKLSCVIDDYNSTPNELDEDELFNSYGLYLNKEVCYYFDKKYFARKHVEKALQRSNTFWHSLCVLTEANFEDIVDKRLSIEKIEEICRKVRLIVVGAYDGEGYVFWEPTK